MKNLYRICIVQASFQKIKNNKRKKEKKRKEGKEGTEMGLEFK